MLKHFSPTTNRLERCRAQPGSCRFLVHGEGVSDVSILEAAVDEALKSGDTNAYLAVREQLDVVRNPTSLFDEVLPVYDELNSEFFDELRSRYDSVAKNGTEFHLAPLDNNHAYWCYTCFGPVRDVSTEAVFKAECGECGAVMHNSVDCGALLRRSEVLFFSDDEVRKNTWYHSSDSPDWAEAVQNGTITAIHAGSLKAAEDRVTGLGRRNETTWIYELRIKSTATVDPSIYNDDPRHHESVYGENRSHVARYLNLFEDTGSISVLVDASQVEIVGRTKVG